MGPKKGKPKGKGKGGKGPESLDEFDTTEMSREQLEVLCLRLREEMQRQREERAFFQLERDKIRAFWEITRKQLDEARAGLRNTDAGREDDEIKHMDEMKDMQHKVKFLQMQQLNELAEKKIEHLKLLQRMEDEYEQEMLELRRDKRTALERIVELQDVQNDAAHQSEIEHSASLTKAREEHANEVQDLGGYFERNVANVRSSLDLKHRVDMMEAEERHKKQIDTLLKNHAKAMSDLKNYYNEITLNNLSLVSSLKAECGDARDREDRALQEARALRVENRRLALPLRQARDELQELRRRMTNYDKDKMALERAGARADAAEKALQGLRWEVDAMTIQLEQVRDDRKELCERLQRTEAEVRLQRARRAVRTERRVQELQMALEQRDAQMAMVEAGDISCSGLEVVRPLLEEKTRRIASLALEVARLQRAHAAALDQLREELVHDADMDDGLRLAPRPIAQPRPRPDAPLPPLCRDWRQLRKEAQRTSLPAHAPK